ncbi:GNAT family N-acetyltransferase [Brevibacillus borstelensis]|uniref:GNAT family N-acetyltransferase n=1 Tax=Brevibacillus borstelensis TaxID=45462 RepID=UPI0030BB56E5
MSISLQGDRILLREMVPDDLPAVLEVYNSHPSHNLWRNGTDAYSLAELKQEYNAMLDVPYGHWIAIQTVHAMPNKPGIIGAVHFSTAHPSPGKGWIGLFLIHRDCEGLGFGREACQLLEHYCAKQGCSQLHLGVIARDEQTLRFWGKLGYEQYRQVTAPVGGLTQPVLLLAKHIGN